MTINKYLGKKLKEYQENKTEFELKDFGVDQVEILANIYFKDIIDSVKNLNIEKTIIGLSMDLSHSPKSKDHLQNFK